MIRKSTVNLKHANRGKLENLRTIAEEYVRIVNLFIDILWQQKQFSGSFVKDTTIESWISARLKQAAAKQALSIVKSQRKKKKKHKPTLNRLALELDSRFIAISQDINHFDIWLKFSSIGNKIIINLPSQKHYHFNKLIHDGWVIKKSARLRINENGYFIDIYFQKQTPDLRGSGKNLAIDIGYKKLIVSSDNKRYGDDKIYDKISRKKQGSKAFKRALIERDEKVNVACKKLPLNNIKTLYAEDLKDVKKKSKGKIRKKFNNKLQRWTYPKVLEKLAMICEERGVEFVKVPPRYTSQRCSRCGVIRKSNRQGEVYKCACGNVMDADYNASLNILHLGEYGLQAFKQVL